MSSSNASPNPRGFLAAFACTLALLGAALVAALVIVDPLGAGHGNALCPAGAKSRLPDYFKFIIPQTQNAQSAILGTSRVHFGFDSALLEETGGTGTVNLGVSAALNADFDVLAEEMLAVGPAPSLFVGTDFNLTHQERGEEPPGRNERASGNVLSRLRAYYFNRGAMIQLPKSIPDCTARNHADGSPILFDSETPFSLARIPRDSEILVERFRAVDSQRLANQRLAQLQAQLRSWKARGANVVIFAAPYSDDFRAVVEDAGMTDAFEAYHRALARISAQEGVPFLDFHGPRQFAALDMQPCPGGGIQCHYYDLTHYDRSVAQAMAPFLRRAMDRTVRSQEHN
ncbi:hypothetical protein GCM10009127_19150 [Alteraurantiacibacter aestuarii]|uniref:hypothetical protein n=1 Tax=Alteraurantiacibacter aestuarii TaxID=650004 RepID=UPI0031E111AB